MNAPPNPLPPTDADVHAYVDGQLASARATEVEDAASRDAALAARLEQARFE